MNTDRAIRSLSPGITTMIRMDHSHVLTMSHRYRVDAQPARKKSIVDAICLALEIHAQLEEEIFYPALETVATGNAVLTKSRPEHDEMKRLIAELRAMAPEDRGYDRAFLELMRDVMHHVADEETVLLPAAESLLVEQLPVLGARMTRRRLQLAAPHAGELLAGSVRTMPPALAITTLGMFVGGLLLGLALRRPSRW